MTDKLTTEQLTEDDTAIDAFQIYSNQINIGTSEFDVLEWGGFFKALAYYLNANTAEDEPSVPHFLARMWADEEIDADTHALLQERWECFREDK